MNRKIKIFYPFDEKTYGPCRPDSLAEYLPYGLGVLSAGFSPEEYDIRIEDLRASEKLRLKKWTISPGSIYRDKNLARACLDDPQRDRRCQLIAKEILDSVEYKGYGVVGFSVFSSAGLISAVLVGREIKNRTGAIIVFGGAYINLEGERILREQKFIDYAVSGDGIGPFRSLIGCIRKNGHADNIPGVLSRNGQKEGGKAVYREDINNFPLPDFDSFDYRRYETREFFGDSYAKQLILPYRVSRGCYNRCAFCRNAFGRRVETKDFKKVTLDLRLYRARYQSSFFRFNDEMLNHSYDFADNLATALKKEIKGIKWKAAAAINGMDRDLLKKIKTSGCYRLCYGLESASDRVLKLMDKRYTSELAARILKLTHRAGIETAVNIMVGFPGEEPADVLKTINFLSANRRYIDYIHYCGKFILYPRTLVYCKPGRFGITGIRRNPEAFKRQTFIYDENGGNSWRRISEQQAGYLRQVRVALRDWFIPVRHGGGLIFVNNRKHRKMTGCAAETEITRDCFL